MSKKRRVFDIDMPVDDTPAADTPAADTAAPETKSITPRRGPMATAIGENSRSLRERQTQEAAIRAENDALAHEHVRLKKLGLIVDMIPLELIDSNKLVRDRAAAPDMDLGELKDSIRDIGLSNPVRVERHGDRYELVQGMRRLTAYRELHAETPGDDFARIPAGLVAQGETLEALYRRMVDENLVRKDISFGEMAQLVRGYVADPETDCDDPDKAVPILFKSAGYQKRSYIRGFVSLLDQIGDSLEHPHEISRSLGLALLKRMEASPGVATGIIAELKGWKDRPIQDELDVLRRFAGGGQGAGAGQGETFPAGKVRDAAKPRKAKTTFQIDRPEGTAKCTASAGRLELRLPVDFSALDRRQLEAAVKALLDDLG